MSRFIFLIILATLCCQPCLAQFKLSPELVEAQVLTQLCAGKQSTAEDLLKAYLPIYRKNQRIVFLYACCLRSRFQVQEAAPIFSAVAGMGTNTVSGQCALHMLYLDANKDVPVHSAALQKLVKRNTNDLMLRWMIAVQCRTHNQDKEGAMHYKKLLDQWDPGPVLVHQTYANLLDNLNRNEEALVERRKAVELEPAGWSYDGLGHTLAVLNRFKEANEAFAKSVELDPGCSTYWTSWAWSLVREKNYPEAIKKCEKAIALNPKDCLAWQDWGRCLEYQGKLQEALVKYNKSLEINGSNAYVKDRIKVVEKQLTESPPRNSAENPGAKP